MFRKTWLLISLVLSSCSLPGGISDRSSLPSEETAFAWSFEEETYVPSLDPSANRIGIIGGTERIATTNLVFYQGYDDINDDEPYVYRDLGSPEHPYGAVEARLSRETDYLAYYLPSARVAALKEGLHSFYESERHSLFGPEEVGLYDGRYIWMNSLEGQDSLLKMMAFDELSEVPLGDGEYELVGLFERREAAVEYDLVLSEERRESHYLLARLILDEEGNPLSSLSSFDRGDDIELAAAVSAYASERRVFEKYEGLVLSGPRGLQGKGSYAQAPFLSASSPFKGEGRFLPLYEIKGMTLLRETRRANGIDLPCPPTPPRTRSIPSATPSGPSSRKPGSSTRKGPTMPISTGGSSASPSGRPGGSTFRRFSPRGPCRASSGGRRRGTSRRRGGSNRSCSLPPGFGGTG